MQCLVVSNALTFLAASRRRLFTPSFSARTAAFRVTRTHATWTRPCSACLRSRWSSTQFCIVRVAPTATQTTTTVSSGLYARASSTRSESKKKHVLLRDAVIAQYMHVPVSVRLFICPSVTSRSSMAGWTELVLGTEASFDQPYTALQGNSAIYTNKSSSLWNFSKAPYLENFIMVYRSWKCVINFVF